MKKLDLGQTITVVANVGVIAGILFLAVELRQNNEFLAAQARATRVGLRQADTSLILSNPELAQILLKHQQRELLTNYETLVLNNYMNFILVNFQSVYREMLEGFIPLETVPLESWRANFRGDEEEIVHLDMREYWRNFSASEFDPDFVEWMEENVVNVR